MKRRHFLATGLGAVVAGAAADGMLMADEPTGQASPAAGTGRHRHCTRATSSSA